MLLTEQERRRFIEWLQQDANSNRMLANQLKLMTGLSALARVKDNEASAEELVARLLAAAESQTIGG